MKNVFNRSRDNSTVTTPKKEETVTVQEAVQSLISEVELKKSIIQAKIQLLTDQSTTKQTNINLMTRQQIDLELADDTAAHSDLAQKIAQAREDLTDITGRIAAYREALADHHNGPIIAKLPELLELEHEQREIRRKAFKDKVAKSVEMQSQFEALGLELQTLKNEIKTESLYGQVREKDLFPLLKALEKRPLKFGKELEYLESISRGQSVEHLVECPQPVWNIPQQEFHKHDVPMRKPGKVIQGKTTTMVPYGFEAENYRMGKSE